MTTPPTTEELIIAMQTADPWDMPSHSEELHALAIARITELQDEVVRLRRLIIESYKAREALSNTAWHARRYAMEDTSYEQFLAWLHWYCPPTFYPYPYKGDAVEIWHRGER